MSLIRFHRFLIACAILFGIYFAWHLFRLWQATGDGAHLGGAVGSAGLVVALCVYLPTVKVPRRNGDGP